MHIHTLAAFRHDHIFLGADHSRNERKTWAVISLCGAMMVVEIIGGAVFGSMALLADGLHMSTHASALVIAALAYVYARRHARNTHFVFGTGKLGDLAGFTSALVLAMIALLMGYESILRVLHPVPIAFDDAIPVAALGLGVNMLSAWLLRDDHHNHAHDTADTPPPDHAHGHGHGHDLNLRAAYVHVLADAVVSVLAIVGLLAGRHLGWLWMDPLMGIVGALVIANWAWGLVRRAGAVLLDMLPDRALNAAITQRLEIGRDRLADLHLWRVGPGHHAAVIALVSDYPEPPSTYKARLAGLPGLSHVTVEVVRCPGPHAAEETAA